MEYRKLPHGNDNERFSVLGLGLGGAQKNSEEELEQIIALALENGINFFDLCGGAKNVYTPFGRAIKEQRDKVFFQLHFGAVYNEKGEYAWSRNLDEIKRTFQWEMDTLGTDYVDLGFLHCVDEAADYDKLVSSGVLDYVQDLKRQGVLRHIGFSSHTPSVAERILDIGGMDMMMFSLNPAYDFEQGGGDDPGSSSERMHLFRRCEAEGVGISVMKPFHAGKLLSADTSPFHQPLTRYQCLQYALDRPGVLTTVPGIRNLRDVNDLLGFVDASPEEKDYSVIGSFSAESITGSCVYCNHCQPCPAGIDVGLVNKYYDLALVGDKLAQEHYRKLSTKADACISCGHCDRRCPFQVPQQHRMKEIAAYFAGV